MKLFLFFLTILPVLASPEENFEKNLKKLQEQYEKAIASGGDRVKLDAVLEREKEKLREAMNAATTGNNIRTFTIDSKAENGARIGTFLTGETIVIEYVEGQWVAYTGWKHESPDEAKTAQHRIALYHRKAGGEETIIAFPSGTKDNPWKHVVDKPGNYYLKIADPVVDSNEGKVIYKVGTIKPEK